MWNAQMHTTNHFRLYDYTAARVVMEFDDNGDLHLNPADDIGFGAETLTPTSYVWIKQESNTSTGGIRLERSNTTNYWAIFQDGSGNLDFVQDGATRGYLSTGVTVNNIDFTGQHRSLVSNTQNNTDNLPKDELIGLIVISDGTYTNLTGGSDPLINEALPNVALSQKAFDKRVFGVISDKEDLTSGERAYELGTFTSVYKTTSSDSERLIINSLGEGSMWICNFSGSLENGDYIASSPIKGLGMKQESSILYNYTVAKITQDCDFNISGSYTEFEWSGSLYRKQFVGVTYHCG